MVTGRKFWLARIKEGWKKRPVLLLAGVRRVGKTLLCKSISGAMYYDCELPRTRRMMDDPQEFLDNHKNKIVVLDEIHRLHNPSELLKIAADHYRNTRIIATGSSVIDGISKYRDTLTGRKLTIRMTPINYFDMQDFGNIDIKHRMLRGGMPEFFLSKSVDESLYQEWVDGYWSKDILELFHLERKHSFQSFVELIMIQSGGIFNASGIASQCSISHTTALNYLKVLEATYVATVIRPYSAYRKTEIVSAPKVYGFDTGFVCYHKGINDLRQDDYGFLWEHIVLNELISRFSDKKINYWRDKQGHEIDFVIKKSDTELITLECKWKARNFDPANLIIFRKKYPTGKNYVICSDADKTFTRNIKGLNICFTCINSAAFSKIL